MIRVKRTGLCLRAICLLLAVIMLGGLLCACTAEELEPVLSYGDHEVSLELYEFMLSRMKGTLARNKYDVTPTSEFWSDMHPSGVTNEEYYNNTIFENCRNYLAAMVIFEEEGLSLSDDVYADIDEEIAFYVDYDCGGSVEKFDAILSKYGTDTEGLRKIYEIEAKYQAVISRLYGANASQIADSVKEPYYEENYYRFKQILVANFYYEFQKDDKGNTIYFSAENGLPLYSESGKFKYDDNGNRLTDSFGVAIRFDEDGKRLYDTENGYPAPVTNEKGEAIKHFYTDSQMAERRAEAEKILTSANGGNYSELESQMEKWQLYDGATDYYPDGYYLSDIESAGYDDYLKDILNNLKEMAVGEVRLIESESGYHVVMRYKLDKGKYSDEEYAEWFANFNQSLITKLFLDRCSKFYSDIAIDEENLKKAKSIKSVGTNYDY